MNPLNRLRGKQNQKAGEFAQQMTERMLWSLGFKCIEPIETGWTVKRRFNPKTGKTVIYSAYPKKKVSGDFTAVGKGGQAIHVEVKQRDEDILIHSALEDHQVAAMDEKTSYGVLCLLSWVRSPVEMKILRWPIPGFKKGSSLKWKDIR